jgi:hypothetical protein
LRLDPENDWARVGLVEALKARFFLYRLMLGFFLWMQRQSGRAQVAVLLGFVFVPRMLRGVARENPALAPWLIPLAVAVMVFAAMTWLADPLGNLLLFLHPLGRMSLKREERWQAMLVGACLLGALTCLAAAAIGARDALLGAMFFGLMIFPTSTIFEVGAGTPRRLMAAVTVGLAALALPFLAYVATGGGVTLFPAEQMLGYWQGFIIGAVLSSWLPTMMLGRRLVR